MTPFPTPAEIAALQADCQEAWEKSKSAEGLEKLQLIRQAFPFAVQGAPGGLRISWDEKGWTIADSGGFITILDKDDIVTMLVILGMESAAPGSFRELIEGKKRREEVKPAPKPPHPDFAKYQRGKITLADIGLGGPK